MSLYIHGIGTALPLHSISQQHSAEFALAHGAAGTERDRQLRALYRLTRVRKRHSVLLESAGPGEAPRQDFYASVDAAGQGPGTGERMDRYEREALPLAVQAARAALADAGRPCAEVSHLVTVSCTGFAAPGVDIGLIRELGLPRTVARTHVGFMGCHGALNALRVARGFAGADTDACVLVCAVELCTLHYQYDWNPDWLVANALFADGAAAVVGGAREPGKGEPWQLAASGSALLEDSAELMSWRVGDHGFEMALSARVPGVIERGLRPWLEAWLALQGLRVGDVASWALHPGGPRILEACAQAIGLRREDYAVSQEVLADYGNMSSPTILFILDRLRARNAPRPCVALGFGPGLAVEAALFR